VHQQKVGKRPIKRSGRKPKLHVISDLGTSKSALSKAGGKHPHVKSKGAHKHYK
jgi:hypothetical protein